MTVLHTMTTKTKHNATEKDMLQRMECAKDFRNAAWNKLGEGAWGSSILGYLFNSVAMVVAFGVILLAIITAASSFGVDELVNVDQDLLNAGQLDGAITFNKIEDAETLANLCKWIAVSSLISLLAFYMVAIFRYGMAAMAVATMRKGARFGHALSGYGKGWSTTWLMALVGMYEFLWTLLFIVPGIRAFYSYRLVYFLKIDRPELPAHKLISESKRLMDGRRWKLFCLDISFIGWFMLSALTRNLLDVMVRPYHMTACAAFYEDLLNRDEAGAFGAEFGADE